MLLAGLAASPLHCAPMCGAFVLGQVSDRMARLPGARLHECHRIAAATLPGYHLGRLTTYSGLGFIVGLGGLAAQRLAGIAGLFLLAAAALLAVQVFRGALQPRRGRGYRLGVALGFLPCGVLYSALAMAAASGSPLTGAAAMLCFGLGTIPALVATGIAGAAAGHRFRARLGRIAPVILLLNAGLLTALGLRMLTAP